MAQIILKLRNSDTKNSTRNLLASGAKNNLSQFLSKIGEMTDARTSVQLLSEDDVAASATVTMAFANQTDGDTIQIGSMTLTARTAVSTTNEFVIGASNTASAVSLALAINTYSNGLLTSTSAGAIVTVRAAYTGVLGNAIPVILTQTLVGMTASGAALSGGLADTALEKDFKSF